MVGSLFPAALGSCLAMFLNSQDAPNSYLGAATSPPAGAPFFALPPGRDFLMYIERRLKSNRAVRAEFLKLTFRIYATLSPRWGLSYTDACANMSDLR